MRFIWKCRRFCLLFCLVSFWKWKILLMLLTNNIDSTYRILSSIFKVPSYVFLPFSLFLLSFLDILRLFIISHTLAVCNVLCKSIELDLNKAAVPAITRKLHITHCKSAADIIWKHPATSRKANIYFSSLELSNAGWAIQQQGQQQWGRVRAKTEQTHQGAALDPALELWSRISKRKQQKKQARGNKFCLFIFFEKNSATKDLFLCFFWRLSHLTSNQILATSCERHPPEVSCNSEVSAKARSMTLKFLWKRDCTQ